MFNALNCIPLSNSGYTCLVVSTILTLILMQNIVEDYFIIIFNVVLGK